MVPPVPPPHAAKARQKAKKIVLKTMAWLFVSF
jgi:hypothetical protein